MFAFFAALGYVRDAAFGVGEPHAPGGGAGAWGIGGGGGVARGFGDAGVATPDVRRDDTSGMC